jgi:hypothetical protein
MFISKPLLIALTAICTVSTFLFPKNFKFSFLTKESGVFFDGNTAIDQIFVGLKSLLPAPNPLKSTTVPSDLLDANTASPLKAELDILHQKIAALPRAEFNVTTRALAESAGLNSLSLGLLGVTLLAVAAALFFGYKYFSLRNNFTKLKTAAEILIENERTTLLQFSAQLRLLNENRLRINTLMEKIREASSQLKIRAASQERDAAESGVRGVLPLVELVARNQKNYVRTQFNGLRERLKELNLSATQRSKLLSAQTLDAAYAKFIKTRQFSVYKNDDAFMLCSTMILLI